MKYLIILLALVSAPAQSYCYARIGVGHSWSNLGWENQDSFGGSAGAGCRHQISGNWHGDINLSHYSQPFIHDNETSSYHAFYWVEYRF